jgi:hypothetical protein
MYAQARMPHVLGFRQLLEKAVERALLRKLGPGPGAIVYRYLMQTPTGGLTGGFLLDILQGRVSDRFQDVDVLVQGPLLEHDFAPGLCYNLASHYKHRDDTDGRDYDIQTNIRFRCMEYYMSSEGRPKCTARLQLLIHDSDANIRRHMKTYDFPFCANVYNGVNGLHMQHMSSVLRKHCNLNILEYLRVARIKTWPEHLMVRLRKYRERGYTICVTRAETEGQINDIIHNKVAAEHWMLSVT